ncbi:MAG: spore germination protein GerW family protein [Anaerolineae bacterium]
MDELKALLEKIGSVGDEINVDAVFGKPEMVGDRVLIPVAEIAYGFGAGMGGGPGGYSKDPGDEEVDESSEGECDEEYGAGGGGGAGGRARPIAYIEVGPDGTKVEPIIDEQKIALAGILLSAWAIAWAGPTLMTLFNALFAPRE